MIDAVVEWPILRFDSSFDGPTQLLLNFAGEGRRNRHCK